MEVHILALAILTTLTWTSHAAEADAPSIGVGFKATPNPDVSSFQPLLNDSSNTYSLGFLRVNRNDLSLSILHVASSVALWSAPPTRSPRWADPTHLLFNGSLVLSDPRTGVYWSTHTTGDRVWLSNSSNLIIQNFGAAILWQSFDFPSDTLVENQNFSSAMALVSSNGLYSMRLGPDYMGLFAKFSDSDSDSDSGQIYLKRTAMQAKADVVPGQPIYMVLKSDGYLGMYQNGSGSTPVDVQSFNTFQKNAPGIRRVRVEPDGNLKGYYWTGSGWILEYQAISEPCELPSSCGLYGLCEPGKGCSCLDNRTVHSSGGCAPPRSQISGDFCGVYEDRFRVLRRTGVELPYKELMGYKKTASYEECEDTCEGNCTCWGVVYSNSSGFCYTLDYPIQTLEAVRDEGKLGYFKVREGVGKKKVGAWVGMGLGLFFGAVLAFVGVLGLWWYKVRDRGVKGYGEDEGGVGVGPYKDLGAASFRSIELSER